MTPDGRATAVIIGGGLAGCFAAAALLDQSQIERIVVVERDHFPERPGFRAGAPQGRHLHLLLDGGRRALRDLLPGLDEELRGLGAVSLSATDSLRWLSAGGWMPRFHTGLEFLCCTRPVLDDAVRRQIRTFPTASAKLEFLEGTEVVGLLGSRTAVTGVRVRVRGSSLDPASTEDLPAAFVVDASGRSSGLPAWLRELGVAAAPEERVDAGVAYSSRLYRRPDKVGVGGDGTGENGTGSAGADNPAGSVGTGDSTAAVGIYLQTKPPDEPRLGVLVPVEGERWIVSVAGMRGAEPEPGEAGFDKQLALLRDPMLRDLLADAEPDGEVRGFRPGASVRRKYERIVPEGLVVVGDAACTFNPVYGQGISVAAFGAVALRNTLRERGLGPGAARRAQARISVASKHAWMLSSAEDVRFAATTGGPSGRLIRWQHRYLDRVLHRATGNEVVCGVFIAVLSLVAPPAALFHPRVMWPVLRKNR